MNHSIKRLISLVKHERIAPKVKLLATVEPKLIKIEKLEDTLAKANYEKLIITNALSPNGDGINDAWDVQDINKYPNNMVCIVNRGEITVYKGKGYDNSLDGNFNGQPSPEGTYYYVEDVSSGTGIRKGFISIVK